MTPICPHCGYDLARDEPMVVGDYSYDPRFGVCLAGQLLPMGPQCHEILGALFRAQGRLLDYGVIMDRASTETMDPLNWIGVQMRRIRAAFEAAGAPCPIRRVWGRGLQWAGPPFGVWRKGPR